MSYISKPMFKPGNNSWVYKVGKTYKDTSTKTLYMADGSKAISKEQALQCWNPLKQAHELAEQEDYSTLTLGRLAELWLIHPLAKGSPDYKKKVVACCRRFDKATGDRPIAHLDSDVAEIWFKSEWANTNTQARNYKDILTVGNFWVKRKRLAVNPLCGAEWPREIRRKKECIPTSAEHEALMKHPDPLFRDILAVIHGTGARPKEILTAKGSEWNGKGILNKGLKHKEGHLGMDKRIRIPKGLWGILDARKGIYGDDYLFPNSAGHHYKTEEFGGRFNRWRDKMGIRPEALLYGERHGFMNDMARAKEQKGWILACMGSTCSKVLDGYLHIAEEEEALQEMVEAAYQRKQGIVS